MLQPGRYWPEFCRHIGREDLITDERFAATEALMGNAPVAADIVQDVLGDQAPRRMGRRFAGMEGQWAVAQDPWEVGQDRRCGPMG